MIKMGQEKLNNKKNENQTKNLWFFFTEKKIQSNRSDFDYFLVLRNTVGEHLLFRILKNLQYIIRIFYNDKGRKGF